MNKLTKVGLTALAASLVSVSASAVDISASGGASISYTSKSNVGDAATGNPWSMGDTVNFSASGEMDNGWTVTMTMGLDDSAVAAGSGFEDRAISIDMGDAGVLSFKGKDGTSVTGVMDDKMPTAYEETWFQADAPGNGSQAANMWTYSNSSIDGVVLEASLTPAGGGEADSSSDVGITYTGIDGLTIGLATGTDSGGTVEVDNSTRYITYAYDAFTFGYQSNAMDSATANADENFTAYAVSYAVNDDLSISYGYSELDYEGTSTLTDTTQEASAISVSYTMGSMAIAATRADVDNQDGDTVKDGEGYEINVAFTF
jgi:outer membrane protein OmpU